MILYRIKIRETKKGKHYTVQKRKLFRRWQDVSSQEYYTEEDARKAAIADYQIKTRYKRIKTK